jgi:hypothetical protein
MRQVHLDFHNSEYLKGIGEAFDKEQFQESLKKGRIDSINLLRNVITVGVIIQPRLGACTLI